MAAHAVLVPFPGRGHINPMMHLARKLASHGISVTLVLTEYWHKIITETEDDDLSHAQKLGLDIQAALIPTWKLIWAVPLAKRHALLSVALWPTSVTNFSIMYHSDLVGLQDCIDYIPGVPSLKPVDLSSSILSPSPVSNEILKSIIDARDTDWVVWNSFYALETKAIDALLHKTPVQSVGPMNMPSAHWGDGKGFDGKGFSQCSEWLDSKLALSVIYVSFGSFVQVSRAQCRSGN
ncbi:hypothetical protein SUGI_0373470 [Cryptomeria japonica]|nr:hypothetical protein SUGI_0373470 [Cryptomeria japonica]